MRSSHMYVGQEVQAGTIHLQTTAQPAIPLDGQTHSAAPLRASISLSPFALPSLPLLAASESRVGHQISALNVLSCSLCPTASERSGRAAFRLLGRSPFATVGWTWVWTLQLNHPRGDEAWRGSGPQSFVAEFALRISALSTVFIQQGVARESSTCQSKESSVAAATPR